MIRATLLALALATGRAQPSAAGRPSTATSVAQKFSALTEITPANVGRARRRLGDPHRRRLRRRLPPHPHARPGGPGAAPHRLVGDPALRQRHPLRRHPLLPHLRPRARHRRGQVDLRQPRRPRGPDPARPEEPRRRLLGRRRPRSRASPASGASTSAPWTPSSTPSTPTPASPAPTSARAASSTSTASTPPTPVAALAAAAAHGLRRHPLPRLGRQGLGRGGRQPRLGLRARRPHRRGADGPSTPCRPSSGPKTGTANVWASMSVDPERHLLYVPVSSPEPQLLPGRRARSTSPSSPPSPRSTPTPAPSSGPASSSTTTSGTYDTNAAPTLVDIEKDGRTIPALVQT